MHGIERMRLFRATALVAGAFILLVHAAGAQGLQPYTVIEAYERAWVERDVDGALSHLADGAVITLQDARTRNLRTREQIRQFLSTTDPQGAPVLTTERKVDGNTITWSERTQTRVLSTTDLTVEAVVQNGKIQSLVYRPGRLVQAAGETASSTEPTAAMMVLAAVVLLGLGLVSLATVRSHVRADSNLRGRMLTEMRHWRPTPRRRSVAT
jgi:hypothetical protein